MSHGVTLIAAVARNGGIGVRNGLPWRLPSDLRHFRASTMGKPLVLGRRTYEAIGRPLPGRFLVVVSRDPALSLPPGVAAARSLEAALATARDLAARHGADETMVGGGGEIYRAAIDRADRLLVTEVDLAPEADATFPAIDPGVWREASRRPQPRAEGDAAATVLVNYVRR